ncbi:MAG: polyphosphate kinase 2 [Hyphomicrobiaceae bacterium]
MKKSKTKSSAAGVAKPDTPPPAFDLEDPELPKWVDEGSLASGGFPYDKRLKEKTFLKELRPLQIELMKLQRSMQKKGDRVVIVVEGRDAAGKGGVIGLFMQHLNPRHARAVALSKPTDAERGQWYFQRYIPHLPTSGDLVMFDRSWYNRAGVEPVMGFCTEEQHETFLREAPAFEGMLVRDGVKLFKLFLTIGREMQMKRFHSRRHDPLKQWKLTDIDLKGLELWNAYSEAQERMFAATHTEKAPWTVVRANDKLRARLAVHQLILSKLDYDGKDAKAVGTPDPKIVGSGPEFFDMPNWDQ